VAGKNEEARKIQMEFLKNAETVVDGLPGVGHLKGAIHILAGDEERGEQIIDGTY